MDWATNRNEGVQRLSLLTTKLHIARARPGLIPRPRLLDRLNSGFQRKLTIVSAPAGFGKTSLLGEWAHTSKQNVAWVSLDEQDNSLPRFWAYFIGALQRLHPGLGDGALAALQGGGSIENNLTALINELAALPQELALVLDDYHAIENDAVHAALSFFIERMPSHLHLYINSRIVPPLKLTRLRADREVIEIRSSDLRFTQREAAELLRSAEGSIITAEEINQIMTDMEGWAVGLQLAAVAVAERHATGIRSRKASGRYRYVTDYLASEVLDRQPEPVMNFLLRTSILDRMEGDLCDALTEREGGEEMLENLVEKNLFVIPVEGEEGWYRYHPMLSDVLRERLARQNPELIGELHQRASRWHNEHGNAAEAVEHLLKSNDTERAIRLAEQHAEHLLAEGDLTPLLSWRTRLPDEMVFARPRLALAFAWALILSSEFDRADKYLTVCRSYVEQEAELGLADIAGHLAAIDKFLGGVRWPGVHGTGGSRGWEKFGAPFPPHRENAGEIGEILPETADPVSTPSRVARGRGAFGLAKALPQIARMQRGMGQLRGAANTYRQSLQLLDREMNADPAHAAVAHIGLGYIHFEWNDLDSTMRNLTDGLGLAREGSDLQTLGDAYLLLARVHQARGDLDGALDAIAEGERMLHERHAPDHLLEAISTHRVQVWLAQGNVQSAALWAQELGLDGALADGEEPDEQRELVLARLFLAQYRGDEAAERLGALIKRVEAGGLNDLLIGALVLQALAYDQQGDADGATAALVRALGLAEPEGYIRTFVQEGGPMGRLIRSIREDDDGAAEPGVAVEYLETLLAALGVTALVEVEAPGRSNGVGYHPAYSTVSLLSPLSERELEVLRLIAAGKSNAAIADTLYISLSTVKTHINNLYSKLGVESRTQALVRAKEINLM
jgi:LuxR family maltose regulon positive regulatory protein